MVIEGATAQPVRLVHWVLPVQEEASDQPVQLVPRVPEVYKVYRDCKVTEVLPDQLVTRDSLAQLALQVLADLWEPQVLLVLPDLLQAYNRLIHTVQTAT
jgi:hypothetical protein